MKYARARPLMEAELGDELLALDPEGGSCFGFNTVAADVWRLIETPRSLDELCAALQRQYDVEEEVCRTELAELMTRLQGLELVRKA